MKTLSLTLRKQRMTTKLMSHIQMRKVVLLVSLKQKTRKRPMKRTPRAAYFTSNH